jgi:DNA-binding TFAR19-related protein (PDSD5 family)
VAEDTERTHYMRKRRHEMQRNLLRRQAMEGREAERRAAHVDGSPSVNETLEQVFAGRAWEVWNAAEAQYPAVTSRVAAVLTSLVARGELKAQVTGEQLFWLFRQLGAPIRLQTKIRLYESGEVRTIADKLRGK